jgi:hypothetical protein
MTERDRELFEDNRSYFDWSKALWKRLVVDPGHPQRRFRLTIDDDELTAVAPEGSGGFTAALRRLCKSYGYNVSRAAEAADRIARTTRFAVPGSLGVLGACVLTAARMGSEERFNAVAYHPRFNKEILGLNSSSTPDGFEELGEKWKHLKQSIYNEGYGTLVLPRDPTRSPLRNKRHINYPLSQCLFRRVDIDRLTEFLSELSDAGLAGEKAFDRLLGYVDYHHNVSAALEASLRGARSDDDLREAYAAALDDLIADSGRRIRAVRRLSKRMVKKSDFGLARLRLVPEHADGTVGYDVILETLRDAEWEPDEDFRCESNDIINGVIVERFGVPYKYLGSDAAVFFQINDYDLVTQRTRKLASYIPIVVVAPKINKAELLAFGTIVRTSDNTIADVPRELPLLSRFEDLTAVHFTFSSLALGEQPLPRCLERFDIAEAPRLSLRGGVSVEGGYLIGVPMRLELAVEEDLMELPAIYCDTQPLVPIEFEDRFEYDLTEVSSSQGQHFVTSSLPGLRLTFAIIDPPRSFSAPPSSGSYYAMYFGQQFLRFLSSAANLKMARKQALEPNSNYVLIQGAFITHDTDDPNVS